MQAEHVHQLMQKKLRILYFLFGFLSLFYFMLPLSLAIIPDVMNRTSFIASLTWAWVYAFAQIPMTWLFGWIYCHKAKQLDRVAAQIRQEDTA